MNDMLRFLREKNPALPLFDVHGREFRKYGAVFAFDGQDALAALLAKTAIPDAGNRYAASEPSFESAGASASLSALCFDGGAVQIGWCNGRGFRLNALEYHRCSEVNLTTTGLVLLLATPDKLRDGILDSRGVVGFYLPPNVAVEIFPMVLHFAPCRVAPGGFNCLVALEKGTNAPLERVDTSLPGEDKLLWMTNKWMTCHPDSPQAEKGAYPGIRGENLTLLI
ncbi:MAG: DUF4867 family protein [Oscillospiraceae bacterium]|nr:DUF4867 family protein [Oscillospiraceae bacterium]